ncbi:MAG: hypothetical protein DI629_03465 [Mesorhizobium amorphae]|nr:MAG: hypothetical protein DI629_03465 [Mesorhizobium amorphae]
MDLRSLPFIIREFRVLAVAIVCAALALSWRLVLFDPLPLATADAVSMEVLRVAVVSLLAIVALAGAMSLPSVREFLRRRAARRPAPAFRVDGDFARALC